MENTDLDAACAALSAYADSIGSRQAHKDSIQDLITDLLLLQIDIGDQDCGSMLASALSNVIEECFYETARVKMGRIHGAILAATD